MRPAVPLFALLLYGIATLWINDRLAWCIFQLGVFALTAWTLVSARRLRLPASAIPIICAALWPWLQIAFHATAAPPNTLIEGLNWITFLATFYLAAETLADSGERRYFLALATIAGTVMAVIAVLQRYTSNGKVYWLFPSGYTEDVFGPFVNRNQFAAWLELIFPAALYLAGFATGRTRTLFAGAAAITFAVILASGSRAGAILALAEAITIVATLTLRKRLQTTIPFLILAVLATGVFGYDTLASRLHSSGPESVRLDAVRASVQMLRDKPLTGFGLGSWASVYPAYAGSDSGVTVNQAHNDWAQWAAEGGVPFAFFLATFAFLLCKSAVPSIYGVGTVAFLLHAFLDYPMQQRPALAAWFFAVAGATAAWTNRPRQHDDGPLRGIGVRPNGVVRGDPAGLQTAGEAAAPRSVRGRPGAPAR